MFDALKLASHGKDSTLRVPTLGGKSTGDVKQVRREVCFKMDTRTSEPSAARLALSASALHELIFIHVRAHVSAYKKGVGGCTQPSVLFFFLFLPRHLQACSLSFKSPRLLSRGGNTRLVICPIGCCLHLSLAVRSVSHRNGEHSGIFSVKSTCFLKVWIREPLRFQSIPVLSFTEKLWVILRSEVARYNQIGQSCIAAVGGLHVKNCHAEVSTTVDQSHECDVDVKITIRYILSSLWNSKHVFVFLGVFCPLRDVLCAFARCLQGSAPHPWSHVDCQINKALSVHK